MRIGMFGTFDVENYGDLLFPVIAERELKQRLENPEIIRFSYRKKNEDSWYYNVASLSDLHKMPAALQDLNCILIGGGHLLRFDKHIADQYTPTIPQIPHPAGYWLTPALAGIAAGLPVIWNAPSASEEFPEWSHSLITFALDHSAYVSMRDKLSVEALRRAGYRGKCHIVPDTVFSLSRHFPKTSLSERTKELLSDIGIERQYLVIQATSFLEPFLRALYVEADPFSDFDILILPVGPILGDDVSQVTHLLPNAKYLLRWPSPLDIAGIVAHSSGVVAVSLHLSITALTYGLPVLRPGNLRRPKYELLQSSENVYFGGPDGPKGIGAFLERIRSGQLQFCSLTKEAQTLLNEHWDQISEICLKHQLNGASKANEYAQANLLVAHQESFGDAKERWHESTQIAELSSQVSKLEQELSEVYRSKAWQVIKILRRARLWVFPPGSKREQVVRGVIQLVRRLRTGNNKEIPAGTIQRGNPIDGTERQQLFLNPKNLTAPDQWTILFVSHDANRAGAQTVLLNTIAWFKQHTHINIKILCLQGGGWLSRFSALGDTITLDDLGFQENEKASLERLIDFCSGIPDLIYGNTVASGRVYEWLHQLNTPILTHIHEMESSFREYGGNWMDDLFHYSSHFIACSQAVQDLLIEKYMIGPDKISLVYASILSGQTTLLNASGKQIARKRLGLKETSILIFGCGIGMPYRKGADLFIQLGETLIRNRARNFHLYWIGDFDPSYINEEHGTWGHHLAKLQDPELREHITFLGFRDNVSEYLSCGDIFVLPSREDPFPLVALEAANAGLPIICFDQAGGMPEFIRDDAGFVVPFVNVDAMAEKVGMLMADEHVREKMGMRARERLLTEFVTDKTSPYILSAARKVAGKKPSVSVIVPNYNHAPFLEQRLMSIYNQSFRDFEVILLDDGSSDTSSTILSAFVHYPDTRVICNEQNSGSPFKQWLKGIDLATSDILWIAESDDTSAPEFLETLLPAFTRQKVYLAYSNSHIINESGEITGDYIGTDYLSSLSTTKWSSDYETTAEQEINDALGIKNTILNMSAVLVRKQPYEQDFRDELINMHIAGDWYFIVRSVRDGHIFYSSKKLNFHRRHSKSVIAQTVNQGKLGEFFQEFYQVQSYIVSAYRLNSEFLPKWESYLRELWAQFTNNKPFDGILDYYPFDRMYHAIKSNIESFYKSQ